MSLLVVHVSLCVQFTCAQMCCQKSNIFCKELPGGGPQGTVLGMFLFLILINAVGFKNLTRNTGTIICNPSIMKRKPMEIFHAKWIDDMTAAESISLKTCLEVSSSLMHPVQFHERTGHFLPPEKSKLQGLLNELNTYIDEKQMKVNNDKTNVILFNKARNYDFLPSLTIGNSSPLNVVNEISLLGIVVSSDLSWAPNTKAMCRKAFSRLWILRRLKLLNVSQSDLLDVYEKQIICICEYACPVWTGALTRQEVVQIECVQKAAYCICNHPWKSV